MTIINEETYNELFSAFLKDEGPNPSKSFFGAWAWHAEKEKAFKKRLHKQNIFVV